MKYFHLILVINLLLNCGAQDNMNPAKEIVRKPLVADAFYPGDTKELKDFVDLYTRETATIQPDEEITGLIAPHAGYIFSGKVAGKAYKELKGRHYDAIIIIAPSHVAAFQGSSVFDGDAYETPLGIVKVDKILAERISNGSKLIKYGLIGHDSSGGRGEHSLEVQLPFLQNVLPGIPIVPIVMGSQNFETCDQLMKSIVKSVNESGKKVLLVASTDLSHFHSEEEAHILDGQLVSAFSNFHYFKMANQLFNRKWEACGGGPVVTVMMAAEQLGANKCSVCEYATSADSDYPADKSKVVGYLSGLITKSNEPEELLPVLSDEDKEHILNAAKAGVKNTVYGFEEKESIKTKFENLSKSYATFVTITKKGNLRGCMGHIYSDLPLIDEIRETSALASQRDYRFGPIEADEIKDLGYEVTILSRMIRVLDLKDIVIGRDGLYIKLGNSSGLLLPQVASERNWDRTTFLQNLSQKAGLNKNDYKDPDAQIFSFRAIVIHDKE
jgi:AmmeMemoRadiSam system protein B/AmmeMemoRadiSam system protein A